MNNGHWFKRPPPIRCQYYKILEWIDFGFMNRHILEIWIFYDPSNLTQHQAPHSCSFTDDNFAILQIKCSVFRSTDPFYPNQHFLVIRGADPRQAQRNKLLATAKDWLEYPGSMRQLLCDHQG
jgi:hypothetical protein